MGRLILGHLALAAAAGELHWGKPDCPCLDPKYKDSPEYSNVKDALKRLNRSESYGLEGCDMYDRPRGVTENECQKWNRNCTKWCFVNMTLCPVNETLCEAAGGQVGSFDSPYCRDRPTIADTTLGAHKSYETCGFLERYYDYEDIDASKEIIQALEGQTMLVAPGEDGLPWVHLPWGKNCTIPRQRPTGLIFELFFDSLDKYLPGDKLKIDIACNMTTDESYTKINYTACCHDVGIGNTDICVGDIWRLPSREAFARFSPTLMDDRFYLVVPRDDSDGSVARFFGRPFWPFKKETWGALIGWLFGMTVVLWGLRAWQMGFAAFENATMRLSLTNFVATMRLSLTNFVMYNIELWDAFLHGHVQVVADTFALRWFRLGFQFFVLVLLESYTANLSRMLVWEEGAAGKVASIQDAIDSGKKICVSVHLKDMLKDVYAKAIFLDLDDSKDGPRHIYSKDCDATVLSERYIEELHWGGIKKRDCDWMVNEHKTDDEAHCKFGFRDTLRDDCIFKKVGEILLTIPVAFPVSDRYLHPVSLAITEYLTNGGLEAAKRNATKYTVPDSKCDDAEDDTAEGLSLHKLGGTFAISFIIVCFGILVCLVQAVCGKVLSAVRAPPPHPPPGPGSRPGGSGIVVSI